MTPWQFEFAFVPEIALTRSRRDLHPSTTMSWVRGSLEAVMQRQNMRMNGDLRLD
jgi:hypothetical protein